MELIASSLTNMGLALFGPGWEQPLAYALNVTEEEVGKWVQDASSIPADLESQLEKIAKTRMGEIHIMMSQMNETGLSREAED